MSRRNAVVLAVVGVVALAGAYWKLALGPQRAEAARLAAAVAAKEAEARDAQDRLASYQRARRSYQANYATLLKLGKAVPEDDDTRSLMVQLDAAARRSGVDFRTVTVGGGATPAAAPADGTAATPTTAPPPGAVSVGSAGFSAMPFTFSFRGDFTELSRFFDRLQRFVTQRNARMTVTGRLLRLNAISLTPDVSGFPRLRAEVSASSFLLPATQGLTAGGTAAGPGTAPGAGGAATTTTATVSGATP